MEDFWGYVVVGLGSVFAAAMIFVLVAGLGWWLLLGPLTVFALYAAGRATLWAINVALRAYRYAVRPRKTM